MADEFEWVPVKWHELTADTEDGEPVGDTIRLSFEDGTVLIGRLTVPSYGSGHHQILRMQTIFGGDTYVFPHGAKLERRQKSERRAPVQGIVLSDPFERIPAGTISWAEHEEAWLGYQKHWPGSARQQDAERIAEHGGFGYKEVCELLGHKPTTWRAR